MTSRRVDVLLVAGVLAGLFITFQALGQTGPQLGSRTVAERLGYPADAKLVIIHADDLGVAYSVDQASFAALDEGAVTSASVMMPCPWVTEVAAYAKAHPDADIGLHLTLTSEWKTYRWGPVASRDQVLSLLDPNGYFWPDVSLVAERARPEEVEREIRAQIDRALQMGIHPTHLDMHMGTLAASPGILRRAGEGWRTSTSFPFSPSRSRTSAAECYPSWARTTSSWTRSSCLTRACRRRSGPRPT